MKLIYIVFALSNWTDVHTTNDLARCEAIAQQLGPRYACQTMVLP